MPTPPVCFLFFLTHDFLIQARHPCSDSIQPYTYIPPTNTRTRCPYLRSSCSPPSASVLPEPRSSFLHGSAAPVLPHSSSSPAITSLRSSCSHPPVSSQVPLHLCCFLYCHKVGWESASPFHSTTNIPVPPEPSQSHAPCKREGSSPKSVCRQQRFPNGPQRVRIP